MYSRFTGSAQPLSNRGRVEEKGIEEETGPAVCGDVAKHSDASGVSGKVCVMATLMGANMM